MVLDFMPNNYMVISSYLSSYCFYYVSIGAVKSSPQVTWEGILRSQSITEGSQSRNSHQILEAGADSEAMKECCFLLVPHCLLNLFV